MTVPRSVDDAKTVRPLVPVLAGSFVLLAILHAVMFSRWGLPKVLPDLPWVIPVTNALVMLSAWSVALLSFGRYSVRHDCVSFWTGLGFAALGTSQVFYVLAWPGLLPDGRAIVGTLPSTAAWVAMLTLGLPGICLLAAVWARWPGPNALPGSRWLWFVGACLLGLVLLNIALIASEAALPVLVQADGHFTPLLRTLQWSITLIFGVGMVASTRYYIKSGDTLRGYAAFSQMFLFFFELAIVLGGTRYADVFFADRFLVIGGFVAILFGLLLEYVQLYRRELARTRELEASTRKLQTSEERYRQLFNDDLTGDFLSTPEGTILLCNPAFARMFGFATTQEALGSNLRELYPDVAERDELVRQVRQQGKVERFQAWRKRRDGTPIHVVKNLVGHFNDRGELYEIRGYIFDDTDRQRAEEALKVSQKRFATLVERAPVGIFETDPQGNCVFANDYWQALAGLSAAEAAGQGWTAALHPEDRERVSAEWYAAAQNQAEFSSTYRFRTPEGKITWVLGNAKPLRDHSGAVVRYLGTLLDITARKEAERMRVLDDVFRVAPSFMHVLRGPSFIFEFANDAYYSLVGNRDLIGRPAFEAMPEAAAGGYPERIARVMATGEPFFGRELPVTLARTLGAKPEERIIDLVYLPLKDADGTCTGVLGHGTDVTDHVRERRRTQDALRQERDFSSAVLDTAAALVVVLDRAARIRRFNRACAALTGYTEAEVLGREVWFLIPPEDLPGVQQEWSTLSAGTTPSQHENQWVAKDGTRRLIAWSNASLTSATGDLEFIIGTGLDISERKGAEQALRESEARMTRAQAIAHLGSWEFDLLKNQLTWSDEVYRIFGFQPLSFPPSYEAFIEAIHPLDREVVSSRFAASLREGKDGYEIEHRIVRAVTGEVRIVHEKCEHLRDDSGRIVRSQGMVHDITDRKRAEEALERSEARLAQGMQVAGLGIFEHDHTTNVVELSSVMKQLLSFGLDDEVTLAGILQKIAPEDRDLFEEKVRRAHDPGGDGRFEVDYRVPDGQGGVRWVTARSQTFFTGQGAERRALRTIGAALDVTHRREAQVRLERLVAERTAQLAEANEGLQHFTHTAAHDLSSPLRGINGFAAILLQQYAPQLDAEGRSVLQRIVGSANQMAKLLNDLLEYSKLAQSELLLEKVSLDDVVRDALNLQEPEIRARQAEVKPVAPLPPVIGHAATMVMVVANLISNGLKFMAPGVKPRLRIWAQVCHEPGSGQSDYSAADDTRRLGNSPPRHPSHPDAAWIRLLVEDNGIGIASQDHDKVFEPFLRLHGKGSYPGTGLGLAIVRKAIQRMGGRVGLESELGKGTRFWIEFRRAE